MRMLIATTMSLAILLLSSGPAYSQDDEQKAILITGASDLEKVLPELDDGKLLLAYADRADAIRTADRFHITASIESIDGDDHVRLYEREERA